jgi:hypothetical protein
MTAHDIEVVSVWVGQNWPSGIIAVGGCDPEGKTFCRAVQEGSDACLDDQHWLTLNEAIAQLAAYDCGTGRMRWIFESTIIFAARRSDGAWAGIVTPRELPQTLVAAVEERLEQFISAAA